MNADGVHIPFFVLKNYLQQLGMERTIIVTDAIAPAGIGQGDILWDDGIWRLVPTWRLVRPMEVHLVGSAISMPKVRENLALELQLDESQIDTFSRSKSRRVLGW